MVTKTLVVMGDPQVTTTPEHPRGAMLRAYDKTTGKEVGAVWMPAPQSGSPMTYLGRRQAVHRRRDQRRQLFGRVPRVRAAGAAREEPMRRMVAVVVVGLLAAAHAAAQQQDFSQVQIKTTKIAGNFYTLEGQGGTIGVLAGPDGVLMVDAQFAPLERQDRRGDQADLRRPHPLPGQHARARRSHRRQREHRQAGRDDLRAREPARAAGEAGAAGQRPAGRAGAADGAADRHLRRADRRST